MPHKCHANFHLFWWPCKSSINARDNSIGTSSASAFVGFQNWCKTTIKNHPGTTGMQAARASQVNLFYPTFSHSTRNLWMVLQCSAHLCTRWWLFNIQCSKRPAPCRLHLFANVVPTKQAGYHTWPCSDCTWSCSLPSWRYPVSSMLRAKYTILIHFDLQTLGKATKNLQSRKRLRYHLSILGSCFQREDVGWILHLLYDAANQHRSGMNACQPARGTVNSLTCWSVNSDAWNWHSSGLQHLRLPGGSLIGHGFV